MEQQQLLEAIENIRRDKHDPWRYMLFTFLNGMAQGLGVALGMTVVLGLALFILTQVIANMVNVPIIGHYFNELGRLIDIYSKQGGKLR
ncbi:hypothetical protein HZC34_07500 [Candidatus Saganbacteria bacterium]|nr:hypothetical protein [Candidatus Saganbacteria bacterium]